MWQLRLNSSTPASSGLQTVEGLSSASVLGMALGLVVILLLVYAVTWLVYAVCHRDSRSGNLLLEVLVAASQFVHKIIAEKLII